MEWNPDPWENSEVDYHPRNPEHRAIGGIVAIPNTKMTPEFARKFATEVLCNNRLYQTLLSEETRNKDIETISRCLSEKTSCGFQFSEPGFRGSFSTMSIDFYNPPSDPWFNYDRSRVDILSFEMQRYEFFIYNRQQVYWFINFMKKVFVYLDGEYGWADHFDYLRKHKYDDARRLIYGLTFYSREMVEQIGRERLLTAPVYRVEELENGGIMLQLHEHPFCKIPERLRNPILKHLGIKKPKRPKPPQWIKKKAPTGIKLKREAKVQLIAGVNASDVLLEGLPQNLFDFYCEEIHPRVSNFEYTPYAVGFQKWFNGLNTGLEAFAAGSDETGGDEFEAYIGLPVGKARDVFASVEKFAPVHSLNISEVKPVLEMVRNRLRELKIKNEPEIYSILYIYVGEPE